MKKIVCVIFLLFPLFFALGQERHIFTIRQQKDTVTENVITSATFSQWAMSFPVPENTPKGRYKIILSYILNPDNTISDISILEDPGYGLGEACKKHLSTISKGDSVFDSITRTRTDRPVKMSIPIRVRID